MAAASAVVVERGTKQFQGMFSEMWKVSATLDAGSLADGAGESDTVTVPGVALGDMVLGVSFGVSAAGVTVTLPASVGNGDVYTIVVGTTVTSNNDIVKVANTSDSFVGRAIASTDNATTTNNIWNVASGNDTITLNGSTKGGYAGDMIQVIDIGSNLFLVNALLKQTAVEATPFSATV